MTTGALVLVSAVWVFAIVVTALIVGAVAAITAGGWLLALGVAVLAFLFVGIFLLMVMAMS